MDLLMHAWLTRWTRHYVLVLGLFSFVHSRNLTSDDVSGVKDLITSTFNLTATYGTLCDAKNASCPIGDNIGALVRLAFHDAAGNGGPNGCIDFSSTTANKGLEDVVQTLNSMYVSNNLSLIISKADLFVLAANTAIEYATTLPTPTISTSLDPPPYTLHLPFRYGRVDASICNDEGSLPAANYTWTEILGLFGGRMDMNVKEIVAIMGAHSLGRCQYANSGFDGGRTVTQSSFSNSYYKAFNDSMWVNNNRSAMWANSDGDTVMLMADVELLFVTSLDGQGTCSSFDGFLPSPACPLQSQTNAAFLAYANNISHFYANYTTAWKKMTEYGYLDTLVSIDSAYIGTYPDINGTTIPTPSPSLSPSISPSALPSLSPSLPTTSTPTLLPTITSMPTVLPSVVPSITPSLSPTDSPSLSLTSTVSVEPTCSPTLSPTIIPTPFPSTVPSTTPSDTPSAIPSAIPSSIPSNVPSSVPSTNPSATPSAIPSSIPSNVPSSVPSTNPTAIPSAFPSSIPSDIPSNIPSFILSTMPTVFSSPMPTTLKPTVVTATPSSASTSPPTVNITAVVTIAVNSGGPTRSPTELPSDAPTSVPTFSVITLSPTATSFPTATTTAAPTVAPSGIPTETPTIISAASTGTPTAAPTTLTESPTLNPTTVLTVSPSISPSVGPTAAPNIPSLSPSASPTGGPTSTPLSSPTLSPTVIAVDPTSLPTQSPSLTEGIIVPTSSPTVVSRISVVQTLDGTDSATWYGDPRIEVCFGRSVADSCGNSVTPVEVNVTAVVDIGNTLMDTSFTDSQVYLRNGRQRLFEADAVENATGNRISVFYYIMPSAPAGSMTALMANITTALITSVDNGSFNSFMQANGALLGVSILSNGSVTAESHSISILGTVTPTATPTSATSLAPSPAPTFLININPGRHGTSTTPIIAIGAVLGVLVAAGLGVMINRCLYFWKSQPAWTGDIVVVDPSAGPEEADM